MLYHVVVPLYSLACSSPAFSACDSQLCLFSSLVSLFVHKARLTSTCLAIGHLAFYSTNQKAPWQRYIFTVYKKITPQRTSTSLPFSSHVLEYLCVISALDRTIIERDSKTFLLGYSVHSSLKNRFCLLFVSITKLLFEIIVIISMSLCFLLFT